MPSNGIDTSGLKNRKAGAATKSSSTKTKTAAVTKKDDFPLDVPESASKWTLTTEDGQKLYTEEAVREVLRRDRRKRASGKDEVLLYIALIILGTVIGFATHEPASHLFEWWIGEPIKRNDHF